MEPASDNPPFEENEPDDAVANAEAAVAALADSFLEWIVQDIAAAHDALERAKASPRDNSDDLKKIFGVMHDLKGQGGSFGYDLLTSIAGSLCEYVRDVSGSLDEPYLKVISAHFAAIDFVIDKNIRGDGDDVGKQLLAKLDELKANTPSPA